MIVEFIGCTGAGKSTLLSYVHDKLANTTEVTTSFNLVANPFGLGSVSSLMIRNLIQEVAVLPIFVRTLYKNKAIVSFILRMLGRQPKFSTYTINNLRGLERTIGVHEKIKCYARNRIILVDEGTIHLAHKVFVFSNAFYTPDEITRFAKLIPVPDLIVYIKAPVETLVQRTLQRSDPPREIRNNQLLTEDFISRACAMFDQITRDEVLKNRVLCVENLGGFGKEFKIVAEYIVKSILNFEGKENLEHTISP